MNTYSWFSKTFFNVNKKSNRNIFALEMKKTHTGVDFRNILSAIKSRDINELKSLLTNKQIHLIDEKLETVLHVAARLGDGDVIRTLLQDRRVARLLDSEMYNGDTPLVVAVKSNNVAAVQILADHGADLWRRKLHSGNTVLHFAASLCSSELLKTLLKYNPPSRVITKTNQFGETAFDIAVMTFSPNVLVMLDAGVDCPKPNHLTGRNVLHTCVAYNKCGVLRQLLALKSSNELTNLADKRGDTPLMLGIKSSCLECIQTLVSYSKISKDFNEVTGESLLHMAVKTDRNDIFSLVLASSHEHVISYKDYEGRTPLLLAIECNKNQCLKRLFNTQNVYEKHGVTKETILHTAVRVNNTEALRLLMKNNNTGGAWCFSQRRNDGKTPFWLAVENDNAQLVGEARKLGWVDIDKLNPQGDSCTYVAAACGHIKVLKALLLSKKFYRFCRTYDISPGFKEKTIVKEAEISCDIYSSDIFILTGEVRGNTSHSWFPQTILNVNKNNKRHIFHACALAGNILCLDFMFTFVQNFVGNHLALFDLPGIFGNTPLHLATRNDLGGPQCVYYLLSQHANISSHNKKGESVLESILKNTEHSTDLLVRILDKGMIYNHEARGLQEENETVLFDFSILRPAGPIMKVTKLFYDKLHGEQRHKLLEHQLFKTYVNLVLDKVNYFFMIRFLLSCWCTLLLSVYIILYIHAQFESPVIRFMRYSLSFFNLVSLLFSIPILLFNEMNIVGLLTLTLIVLPSLMVLGLTVFPHGSEISFEVAAITVLLAFLSLAMYSTIIFKTISHQVAMLTQVVYQMLKFSSTMFCVLGAFSLAFYCIFNNSFYFVSPLKSFLYTTFVMLLADTSESFNFFRRKHFSYNKTNFDNSTVPAYTGFAGQLDLYFESTIILAFIIMANLALLNVLVSLAVRDGKTLETSGSIFQRHLQIHWLSNLELFLRSSIYKSICNTPLTYLLGIVSSKTVIDVGIIYHPMFEKKSAILSQKYVRELRRSLARSKITRATNLFLNLEAVDEIILRRSELGMN